MDTFTYINETLPMEAVDNISVYCCGLAHLLAYFLHTLSTNRQLESSCDSLAWCSGVTRVWVLCLLSSLPPHCLPPLHTSSLHCRTFVRGRMTSVGGCNMFFFWQGVVFSLGKNENNEIINHCMDRKFYICSLLSCIIWFVCEKLPHKVPKCSAM